MQVLKNHTGIVLPLMANNIDTDQIIPSREMKKVSKIGLGEGLFSGQRFIYDGDVKTAVNPEFILNQTPYDQSSILLAGKNFGCGSSREHAVWALVEYGFRVLIAQSYGEIFRNNCIRNGLLPIVLSEAQIQQINQVLTQQSSHQSLTVDLEQCHIHLPNQKHFSFDIEEYPRKMLLNGWDFIDVVMQYQTTINDFIQKDRHYRAWAHL